MKKLKFTGLILIVFLLSNNIFAQENSEVKQLKKIYSNLEYNTTAFNDVKKQWIINDPLIVRESFNRFVVKNAIRLNGLQITPGQLDEMTERIYGEEVVLDVRKRYYDNEIDYMAFIIPSEIENSQPAMLCDPVNDGFYLKSIVGEILYRKIQSKNYSYSNLSSINFESKEGTFIDIQLNLLNPEISLWSASTEDKNRYVVSAFGKWGNDKIFIPGWYLNEYIGGLKLTNFKTFQNDSRYYTYSLAAGYGSKSSLPLTNYLPAIPLIKSGPSVYFKLSFDPLQIFADEYEYLYLNFEGNFNTSSYNKSDLELNGIKSFYSIKDYFSVNITKKDLFRVNDLGAFEAGIGINAFSLYHFNYYQTSNEIELSKPNKKWVDRFERLATANFGFSQNGGLIQYEISTNLGYNFDRKDVLTGAGMKFMLSNTLGFDIRYVYSLNFKDKTQPWRNNSYLVFSPILRINY